MKLAQLHALYARRKISEQERGGLQSLPATFCDAADFYSQGEPNRRLRHHHSFVTVRKGTFDRWWNEEIQSDEENKPKFSNYVLTEPKDDEQ